MKDSEHCRNENGSQREKSDYLTQSLFVGDSSVIPIVQGCTVLAEDVDCSARCFRLHNENCFGNS